MGASIPPWDLLGRLGDDDVVVVDCRSAEECRLWPVQVPGALHMSLSEIVAAPWTLPDDELIVLYDGSGHGSVLKRAHEVLQRAGRMAAPLDGGLLAWITAGFPTEGLSWSPRESRGYEAASASSPGHG